MPILSIAKCKVDDGSEKSDDKAMKAETFSQRLAQLIAGRGRGGHRLSENLTDSRFPMRPARFAPDLAVANFSP